MKLKVLRVTVDIVMFLALILVVITPYFIRIPTIGRGWDFLGWNLSDWHQNLGWFLAVVMVVHTLLNIKWEIAIFKNWRKLNRGTKIQAIVILLLFISMAASIISGAVWGMFSGPPPEAGRRTGEHLRYPGAYSREPGEYVYVESGVAIYIDGELLSDLEGVSVVIGDERLAASGGYVYVPGSYVYCADGERVYTAGAYRYDADGNPIRANASQHVRVVHILTSWAAVLFAGMHMGLHFNRFMSFFKPRSSTSTNEAKPKPAAS